MGQVRLPRGGEAGAAPRTVRAPRCTVRITSEILRHASWDGRVARVCLHHPRTNYCTSQRDTSIAEPATWSAWDRRGVTCTATSSRHDAEVEINTIGDKLPARQRPRRTSTRNAKANRLKPGRSGQTTHIEENATRAGTVPPCISTNRANLLSTTLRSAVALCLRPAGTPATAARKVSEAMIWVAKHN